MLNKPIRMQQVKTNQLCIILAGVKGTTMGDLDSEPGMLTPFGFSYTGVIYLRTTAFFLQKRSGPNSREVGNYSCNKDKRFKN